MGAAVRRAREAVIVAEGEGGLGWASYVLYGDPAYVPLGTASATVSQPALPTPADLVARESIKGVVKVRMTKRGDVTGEVLAPTRGGVITQISVDDGTGPAQVVDALAAPPSAIQRTGPTDVLPDAPRRTLEAPAKSAPSARTTLGIWISIAIILAALATIVVSLAR
jgi:hypothetical protein